jgi:hypothetical protein
LAGAWLAATDSTLECGAGFAFGSFAAAGFAATGLELGFGDFTGTFVMATGVGFADGFAVFFLGAATFAVVFFGVAFPGRLAALLGFFEGI